jgi:hypothetical protein
MCLLREMRPLAVAAAGSSRVAVFAVDVLMVIVYNPGRRGCLYIQGLDLCVVMSE